VLRTLWDSGKVEPLTKTTKSKTTGAHVGVVTHITAPELARLLDETEALNGFANRFLWVCARRQKLVPLPRPMPHGEVAALQRRILAALEAGRELGRLDFDQGARALWLAAYPDLSQDHPGLAGTVINRGEAQVLRLALVYALLDSADEIQAGHLQAALALWNYCRDSARYIFGGREADPIAERVLSALGTGPVTATELHRALGNHVSKTRLQTALSDLLASGRVVEDKESTKGRPRSTYRLCEESEKCEISLRLELAEKVSSLSSLNSQANCDLWTGPAEVAL
jgi:predicted transcriptional regulator